MVKKFSSSSIHHANNNQRKRGKAKIKEERTTSGPSLLPSDYNGTLRRSKRPPQRGHLAWADMVYYGDLTSRFPTVDEISAFAVSPSSLTATELALDKTPSPGKAMASRRRYKVTSAVITRHGFNCREQADETAPLDDSAPSLSLLSVASSGLCVKGLSPSGPQKHEENLTTESETIQHQTKSVDETNKRKSNISSKKPDCLAKINRSCPPRIDCKGKEMNLVLVPCKAQEKKYLQLLVSHRLDGRQGGGEGQQHRRGYIMEGIPPELLHALYEKFLFKLAKRKLERVQYRFPFLKNCRLRESGFPASTFKSEFYERSRPRQQFWASWEKQLAHALKTTLQQEHYCRPEHDISFYYSWLHTDNSLPQEPHIDFDWRYALPEVYENHSESRPYDYDMWVSDAAKVNRHALLYKPQHYRQWVPFIAFFPLTEAGMVVELWKELPLEEFLYCPPPAMSLSDEKASVLVELKYGQMMLLRADVVHAGGFKTADNGNPRGHLYIYKSKIARAEERRHLSSPSTANDSLNAVSQGVQHKEPPRSSYKTLHGQPAQLEWFYPHCAEVWDHDRFKFASDV